MRTSDQIILSAMIESRDAWRLVRKHLESADLGPQAEAWLPVLDEWYETDPGASGAMRELLADQCVKLPEAHRDGLREWLLALPEVPSGINVAKHVLELKRENAARALAGILLQGKPAGAALAEYRELEAATELPKSRKAEGRWAETDVRKLIEQSKPENLIPVFPKALRVACCGGLEPGDHIVVFARPEMGKSLFALNMVHGWLRHGLRVLYVGNEDNIDKLRRRLVCALSNMTPEETRQFPDEAERRAKQYGIDNCFMWWQGGMTMADLEEKIIETQPQCLVLDQLRGFAGKEQGMTQKIEELAIGVRHLLGKYGILGLSTNQGNDRTERHNQEPPVWLKMGDVADSRTGLPAQADLLLGIGADSDMMARNERACTILKNKGEGSHEGFRFWIDTLRTRIR